MAQLIKLQDYISRYEVDIFRYPTQFVRLKKQQWEKVYGMWKKDGIAENSNYEDDSHNDILEKPLHRKLKLLFNKERETERVLFDQSREEDNDTMLFFTNFQTFPEKEVELKKQFLDQLFHFQLKWASSTLIEKSFVDSSYNRDQNLRYFLQRFPDNYLLIYNPVLQLKNAPVELEILLLTPKEVICITFLESFDGTAYIGGKERFWTEIYKDKEKKIVNPIISLKRMENIVSNIFSHHKIDLPIKKLILSRNGFIDYPTLPQDVMSIDQRNYDEWFEKMRSFRSPIKNNQIRAAQAILTYCQTTSFKRLEWDEHKDLPKGE
ncbi:nuclease-related domain-containing protein [Bacillus spongiae]|uniref:Nuclease-related domain-containing protein n=1 Tax=Bacillus spongiae TaxID=2683610 RepID=A0ABU8HI42_9BACI